MPYSGQTSVQVHSTQHTESTVAEIFPVAGPLALSSGPADSAVWYERNSNSFATRTKKKWS